MWIDIIIAIILIYCTVQGYRHGFMKTVLDTVGWFASIILSYFLSSYAATYIASHTNLYNTFYQKIQGRITEQGTATLQNLIDALPQVMKDYFYKAMENVSSDVATSLTGVFFHIASFVAVVLALKLVFWLIQLIFSKKHRGGVLGVVDGLTGALTGLIKGLVISYVLLALLVPASASIGGTFVTDAIANSYASRYLYNYNVLLLMVNKFIGGQ